MGELGAAVLAEQFDSRIGTTCVFDGFQYVHGDEAGLRVPAPGQDHAAAEQPHLVDEFGQVRPRFGDGLGVRCAHEIRLTRRLLVQQDGVYCLSMSSREDLAHLMAQYWECPVPAAAAAVDQTLAAWKQAMADFGVPEHPDGKCPSLPCPCSAMAELVTFRAYELMGLPPESAMEDY